MRINTNETRCDLDIVFAGDFGGHVMEQLKYSAQSSGLFMSGGGSVFGKVVSDEQLDATFGRFTKPL